MTARSPRSLIRRTAAPAALLMFANVVANAVTLVSGLYVARSLATPVYGAYAFMSNVFLLASLLAGFGLTRQVIKDVAEQQHDPEALRQRLSALVALRLATCALAAGGGLLSWRVYANVAYAYAGLGAALFMWTDFVIGALSGMQRLRTIALLLVATPLVFVGLVAVLPLPNVHAIYVIFLVSQLAGGACATVAFCGVPVLRVWPRLGAVGRLPWRTLVIGQTYLVVLIQTAYGAYGTALLGAAGHYTEAGELSLALTLVRLVPLLGGTLVSVVYFPRVCAFHAHQKPLALQALATRAYTVALAVGIGSAAFLIAYRDAAIAMLFTDRHAAAVPLVQVLALLSCWGVVDHVLTWTLMAANRSWRALWPLLVRMALVLPALLGAYVWPAPTLLRVVAVLYLLSATVGWVLQLRAVFQSAWLWQIGAAAATFAGALLILNAARRATAWAVPVHQTMIGLLLAASVYAIVGLWYYRRWLAWRHNT